MQFLCISLEKKCIDVRLGKLDISTCQMSAFLSHTDTEICQPQKFVAIILFTINE